MYEYITYGILFIIIVIYIMLIIITLAFCKYKY